MKTKINDIKLSSLSNSYDIIVATETWLDDTVLENELFDTRYNVYRRDRSSTCLAGKGGGGVLIAVSKSLSSKRVNHFESIYEDLWVSVNAKVHGKVVEYLFCAVYLPPPVKPNVLEIFLENCNVVMQSSCNRSVILGDFNLGFIDWVMDNQNKKMIPSNYSSTLGYQLIDFLSLNDLSQFNSVKNKKSRILDLALSNSNDLHVTESQCQMSKLDSHHPALEINMNVSTDPLLLKNKTFATHNFKKADYSTVNLKLSQIDWNSELDHMRDVDAMVSKFYDIINKIIVETVPKTNVRNLKYPIWFTRNLIKIIKEKERIQLKICNRRVKTAIANCYSAYVKEIEYSQVSIFADDLKLYKCIKDWADVSLLQADLDTISEWCVRNKMKLNPLKCNHIKFTRKKNIVESCYSISGQIVEESTKIRDLGVLLDDKLNFIEHIDNIITRSWKMLGFVKRVCKDFKNIHTLKIIYNALIRSNLEYASTIWNPIYEVHSLRIERIQKNFTRHLAYKSRDCPRTADYDVPFVGQVRRKPGKLAQS
ncbi:hypothetical protein ABMA28_001768 [Loxostege sticticalis]|uniref:Endonuclease/exonuclease/phosphatase domain-containing protein n=1 Tax=Loxostege sticticalis TaxID=481309 RepID=A0ABD0T327_LOXSC